MSDHPTDISRCGKCGRPYEVSGLYVAPDDYCLKALIDSGGYGGDVEVLEKYMDCKGFWCADCLHDMARQFDEGALSD